jgi:hypothetical protein
MIMPNVFNETFIPTVEFARTKGLQNKNVLISLAVIHNADTVYALIDALDQCIQLCTKSKSESDPAVLLLSTRLLRFSQIILNAEDIVDTRLKLQARRQNKSIDPFYMPWSLPVTAVDANKHSNRQSFLKATRFRIIRNLTEKRYIFAEKTGLQKDIAQQVTHIQKQAEREKYRIFAHDGVFYELIRTEKSLAFQPVHLKKQNIFVISPKGDIYIAEKQIGAFHHSSFLAGGAVLFAGSIGINEGRLEYFTDISGHYRPDPIHIYQAIVFFKRLQLLQENTKLCIWDDPRQTAVECLPGHKGIYRKPAELLLALTNRTILARATLMSDRKTLSPVAPTSASLSLSSATMFAPSSRTGKRSAKDAGLVAPTAKRPKTK